MKRFAVFLVAGLVMYHPAAAQQDSAAFELRLKTAIAGLTCTSPDQRDPVSVNAVLIKDSVSGKMAVIIKTLIAPGWHLYAFVPSNLPYITTECVEKLPAGLTPAGNWQKSPSNISGTDPGVMIWEHEAVFVRRLRSDIQQAKGVLQAGLAYQTCDLRQCLPPKEKWFDLKF